MSPNRIYRLSMWLPLVVPVVVIVVMNIWIKGFGLPKPSGFLDLALEVVAGSLLIGGLPYIALALWASRWMRGRSEPDIRRLMYVAPLLMVAVFGATCLVIGVFEDRISDRLALAAFGARTIIPLGYAYVALTMLLRRWLGPRAVEGTT